MAKQNDQTGVEDAAPVKNKSVKSPSDTHAKLREKRRELEAELAAIDGKIRDAISAGDIPTLETLTARKAELPKLFMAASLAETNARHDVFNAEDEANLERLHAAETKRDKLQIALTKRRQEYEVELAEMVERLNEANQGVSEAYSTIQASRDLGGACDAGFQRSLATLAGV